VINQKALSGVGDAIKPGLAQGAGESWVLIFKTQQTLGRAREGGRRAQGLPPETIRWVLDPRAAHCAASSGYHGCPDLAGEYDSWDALPTVPAAQVTCRGNCRCHLEVMRDGQWQRGVFNLDEPVDIPPPPKPVKPQDRVPEPPMRDIKGKPVKPTSDQSLSARQLIGSMEPKARDEVMARLRAYPPVQLTESEWQKHQNTKHWQTAIGLYYRHTGEIYLRHTDASTFSHEVAHLINDVHPDSARINSEMMVCYNYHKHDREFRSHARSNHREMWADSCDMYIHNPARLKEIAPDIFSLVRSIFGG